MDCLKRLRHVFFKKILLELSLSLLEKEAIWPLPGIFHVRQVHCFQNVGTIPKENG